MFSLGMRRLYIAISFITILPCPAGNRHYAMNGAAVREAVAKLVWMTRRDPQQSGSVSRVGEHQCRALISQWTWGRDEDGKDRRRWIAIFKTGNGADRQGPCSFTLILTESPPVQFCLLGKCSFFFRIVGYGSKRSRAQLPVDLFDILCQGSIFRLKGAC
jgi:hypothetical protein